MKQKINPTLFFVFNVLFISLAQSLLLFLITTPSYVILLTARLGEKMSTADVVFARVLIALVAAEFFADGQQWSRQPQLPLINLLLTHFIQPTRKPRDNTRRLPKFHISLIK